MSFHVTYEPFADVLDVTLSDPDQVNVVEGGRHLWLFFDALHTACDQLAGFSVRAASANDFKVSPAELIGQEAWAACSELVASHRAGSLELTIAQEALPALQMRWAEVRGEYQPVPVSSDRMALS